MPTVGSVWTEVSEVCCSSPLSLSAGVFSFLTLKFSLYTRTYFQISYLVDSRQNSYVSIRVVYCCSAGRTSKPGVGKYTGVDDMFYWVNLVQYEQPTQTVPYSKFVLCIAAFSSNAKRSLLNHTTSTRDEHTPGQLGDANKCHTRAKPIPLLASINGHSQHPYPRDTLSYIVRL